MSLSRFTNIYKILKDVNFANENTINSDVLCIICNKLLINAHNVPCGCRYCLECLTEYLDGEDQYCPGNTDDCKIELLNINNNINADQPMNIKISRLMVKCSNRDCEEKIELRKFEDHILVCSWKPTNCPFYNIGCKNVQMTYDKIGEHLLSENQAHTKLLMDCIDIVRKEFGEIMEAVKEVQMEVRNTKVELREMREEIGEIKGEVRKIKEEMKEEINAEVRKIRAEAKEIQVEVTHVKERMSEMKIEVKEIGEELKVELGEATKEIQAGFIEIKKEIDEMKEGIKAEMVEMKTEVKGKQLEIDELRALIAQQARDMALMRQEMVALANANRECTDKLAGLGTQLECYKATNLEVRNNGDKQVADRFQRIESQGTNVGAKIDGLEKRLTAMDAQQTQLNYGEFLWPIDNFPDKRQRAQQRLETEILSEPFFSHRNGYKMRLCVYPDGLCSGKGSHLSVFVQLMSGPFDAVLQWPLKCDVSVVLVNQKSGLSHASYTIRYEGLPRIMNWKAPVGDRLSGYGNHQLIKLDELANDGELCANGRIFIKCSVRAS